MSVKRYTPSLIVGDGYGSFRNGAVEQEDGEFVRYEDHAAMEAENERLKAEVERLLEDAQAHAVDVDYELSRLRAERDEARARVALFHYEVERLREALRNAHLCDCNPAARAALEEAEGT